MKRHYNFQVSNLLNYKFQHKTDKTFHRFASVTVTLSRYTL